MSKKETMELEWFTTEEKIPEQFILLFCKSDEDKIYICRRIGATYSPINYVSENWKMLEWSYYPFPD
jgi:hypothetical protein